MQITSDPYSEWSLNDKICTLVVSGENFIGSYNNVRFSTRNLFFLLNILKNSFCPKRNNQLKALFSSFKCIVAIKQSQLMGSITLIIITFDIYAYTAYAFTALDYGVFKRKIATTRPKSLSFAFQLNAIHGWWMMKSGKSWKMFLNWRNWTWWVRHGTYMIFWLYHSKAI